MKNIGWYTRDGHLDFFAKLSAQLQDNGNKIASYYICHTEDEEKRLKSEYGISPYNLGKYLETNSLFTDCSNKRIRDIEAKYKNIPLRRLLWSEMYEKNYSEETLIYHLIVHFDFWEDFIGKNKIEIMISERPSILSTSVLWVVCKHFNVDFIDFINIGLDGRITFTKSWEGDISGFCQAFDSIIVNKNSKIYNKSVSYLNKMMKNPEKPEYIHKNLSTGKIIGKYELFQRSPFPLKISMFAKWLIKRSQRQTYYLKKRSRAVTVFNEWVVPFCRIQIHKQFSIFSTISPQKEKFFIFPLHIYHEWSDYPWMGLKYPNMLSLIKEVSACLPLRYKLYVKDHTTNFPEKSLSFYRSLKKNPRIVLVSPYEDTYKLLKESEGIVTIGSTMGWEGFLMGKPVIILGEAWYRKLPGVFTASDDKSLCELLQNSSKLPLATEDDKIRAIYALYTLSFKAERYPIVDLISPENISKYIPPFESWIL